MDYILLTQLCSKKDRTKEKVRKWIGIEPFVQYEEFCIRWHGLRKRLEKLNEEADAEQVKMMSMYVLQSFYMKEYEMERPFYEQFSQRLQVLEHALD